MSFCRYGPDVENYLEVYLKTPNLPKGDIARALLARGNARKAGGDMLLAKAHQGHTPVTYTAERCKSLLIH